MVPTLGPFDYASMGVIAAGLVLLARKGMPKAYALGLVILAVYGIDVVAGLRGEPPTALALGFVAEDVVQGGRLWSVVTSLFSHAGFAHVFGNLFILVTAGPALEDRVGARKFLLIYFAAGFLALAAHLLLAYATPIVAPDSLAVGASGAIFGILTAFAVRHPREKLPVFFLFLLVWVPSFVVLLMHLGLNIWYMFTITSVAWWGHFAGFLAGLAFAYTLPAGPPAAGSKAAARGLPDPAKLAPLATTPHLSRILERIKQFTPETRTNDDAFYVDAWLGKFFDKATCPQGHPFTRDGLSATCAGGETKLEFGRT